MRTRREGIEDMNPMHRAFVRGMEGYAMFEGGEMEKCQNDKKQNASFASELCAGRHTYVDG